MARNHVIVRAQFIHTEMNAHGKTVLHQMYGAEAYETKPKNVKKIFSLVYYHLPVKYQVLLHVHFVCFCSCI